MGRGWRISILIIQKFARELLLKTRKNGFLKPVQKALSALSRRKAVIHAGCEAKISLPCPSFSPYAKCGSAAKIKAFTQNLPKFV
jgi:hypothetical protein